MVRGREAKLVKLAAANAPYAFLDLPWDEALQAFRERVPTRENELEKLLKAYAQRSDEARQLALEQIQKFVKSSLERHIAEGGTYSDFADDLESGKESLGITTEDPAYLKMVFRTNVQSAYGAGRFRAITDPDVIELRPYVQYRTVGDARVRPEHAVLDRGIYSAASDEWHRIAPPNSFNCRCSMVSLSKDEVGNASVLGQVPADYVSSTPEFDSAPMPHIEPANDNAREMSVKPTQLELAYNPGQSRANDGKWTAGGLNGAKGKPATKPAAKAEPTKPVARKRKSAADALAEIKARVKAKADKEVAKKSAAPAAVRKKPDAAAITKAKEKVSKVAEAAKKKQPATDAKPTKPTADERAAAKKAVADKKESDRKAVAMAKAKERVSKLAEKMRAKQAKDEERYRAKKAKQEARAQKERDSLAAADEKRRAEASAAHPAAKPDKSDDVAAKKAVEAERVASDSRAHAVSRGEFEAFARKAATTPIAPGKPDSPMRRHVGELIRRAVPGANLGEHGIGTIRVFADHEMRAQGARASYNTDSGDINLSKSDQEVLAKSRPEISEDDEAYMRHRAGQLDKLGKDFLAASKKKGKRSAQRQQEILDQASALHLDRKAKDIERALDARETWDGAMATMVHEEVHAHGPLSSNSTLYAKSGAVIEETTTEMLARRIVYDRLREKQTRSYQQDINNVVGVLAKVSKRSHDDAYELAVKAAAGYKRHHSIGSSGSLTNTFADEVKKHAPDVDLDTLRAMLGELRLSTGHT